MMNGWIKIALPLLLFTTSAAGEGDGLACRRIHAALRKIPGEFHNCHLVLATRGNMTSMVDGAKTRPPINFFDVWMIGENVQSRNVEGEPGGPRRWWEGFTGLAEPLRTDTLDAAEGYKTCARAAGDVLWADYIVMPLARLCTSISAHFSHSNHFSSIARNDEGPLARPPRPRA